MNEQAPRTQTLSDGLDPARASAFLATLGLPGEIIHGAALPPFFQHLYFWEPQPPEALGRDGHPKTGDFLPDMGLPRRMWAAGRVKFHQPLRAGIKAEKISTVEAVTRKDGRSGPLAFVRVRHDFRQRHALALTEWQELVYQPDRKRSETPQEFPIAPTDESHSETVVFDSTLLFRYSALTFNGHRIHYDRLYAKRVEKFDGLVVHGPLLAQLLMLMCERMLERPLREFSYRATAPLLEGEEAELCWLNGVAWVRGPGGRQCIRAYAV